MGALEGDVFEAFAEQADEDDFLGDFRPAGEDGGDAGDGDGQVGADAALEKGVEGAVKDAGAAEDGGDEGEAEAEAEQAHHVGAGRQPEPEVGGDEDGEDGGEQVEEEPAFGLKVLAGVGNLAVHWGVVVGKSPAVRGTKDIGSLPVGGLSDKRTTARRRRQNFPVRMAPIIFQ